MIAARPSALVPILAAFALLMALAAPLAPVAASEAPPAASETGRYIAIVADGVDPAEVARDHGQRPAHVYDRALNGFVTGMSSADAAELQRDERVRYVEAETIERIVAQELPTGIDRIETDRNPTVSTDGSGVSVKLDVAVIDTGIQSDHPDLNVAGGVSFAGGDSEDGNGHGTHVAGTIGAIDNGVGVVGVAPGAPVWAVKVCKNGGICMSGDIIAGIDWVAEQKASGAIDFAAANFSISSSDSDNDCSSPANATHEAICGLVREGVVFTMAAGNDNREKTPYPITFSVSAIADFDGKAGGVADPTCRSDTDDTLANFSNHGEKIKIAAPGVCILSTWNDGGYHTISGTSMAAPHAAGAVALYLHANGLAPAQGTEGVAAIEDAIIGAAHPQGTQNHECSYDDARIGGPLLFVNATAFGGDGSCEVASTDTATGAIAGTVTDAANGDAIDGATVAVEGTDLSATTDADGKYTITDVPEGTHNVTASADGYDSQTEEATVVENETTTLDFALTATEETGAGTASVDAINYATRGGPNSDRHLDVTVVIVDDAGNPVADASVSATLKHDDGASWNFSGTTGDDGTVTFTLVNHGSGCYETTITDVTAEGLTWDGATPENDYCKN